MKTKRPKTTTSLKTSVLDSNTFLICFLIFVIIFLLSSCSSEIIEEEDCGCVKTTYYYKDISTEYIQHIDTYILSIENVPCSNEAFKELISENIYYTIRCNE